MTAPDASRFVAIPGYAKTSGQGLVGVLTNPLSSGETYYLSAQIAAADNRQPGTFEIILVDTITSTQSPLLLHRTLSYSGNWATISTTFTAPTGYNHIQIKAYLEGSINLVDNLQLCEAATQSNACVSGAANSVQNGSFEQGVQSPGTPLRILNSSTTQVPFWTELSVTVDQPFVISGGYWPGPSSPYQGSWEAVFDESDVDHQLQGIIGRLSSSAIPGTTYVLSLHIAAHIWNGTGKFQAALRNSSNAQESPPVVMAHITSQSQDTWVLVSGVIQPTIAYDSIVIRYDSNYTWGNAFVDEVNLCAATLLVAQPTAHPFWWTGILGVTAVIIVFLSGLIVLGRRYNWLTSLSHLFHLR